jgi:hypothetical protein
MGAPTFRVTANRGQSCVPDENLSVHWQFVNLREWTEVSFSVILRAAELMEDTGLVRACAPSVSDSWNTENGSFSKPRPT